MRDDSGILNQLIERLSLRAASVIVTIYGDIVVPRGGTLWMGSLIQIGAGLGLSETLVRTAVSRLVMTGSLTGMREGRRSYYQLADNAVQEFAAADALLFGTPKIAKGWAIHQGQLSDDILRQATLARIGPDLYLRPRHQGEQLNIPGLCFTADLMSGQENLRDYAAGLWDMAGLAARYQHFLTLFSPLAAGQQAGAFAPQTAMAIRLLMVHAYRQVVLRDPHLPDEALPTQWPARPAGNLFRSLYLALSPGADAHIAGHCENAAGKLPRETERTKARLHLAG